MKALRFCAWGGCWGVVCFLSLLVSPARGGEVMLFEGVPTYPGVDEIAETGTAEATGCVVYECSGEEAGMQYASDPEGFVSKVATYYKEKLKKAGWQYLGEGAGRHHWSKGKEAVALGALDYCAIEYRHLGVEEARANMGTIDEKDFFTAMTSCVAEAQAVCTQHGVGDMSAYQKKTMEFISQGDMEGLEAFQDNLRRECRAAMWSALKPHGVTPERLLELFEESDVLPMRWVQEYSGFMVENALGLTMFMQESE